MYFYNPLEEGVRPSCPFPTVNSGGSLRTPVFGVAVDITGVITWDFSSPGLGTWDVCTGTNLFPGVLIHFQDLCSTRTWWTHPGLTLVSTGVFSLRLPRGRVSLLSHAPLSRLSLLLRPGPLTSLDGVRVGCLPRNVLQSVRPEYRCRRQRVNGTRHPTLSESPSLRPACGGPVHTRLRPRNVHSDTVSRFFVFFTYLSSVPFACTSHRLGTVRAWAETE